VIAREVGKRFDTHSERSEAEAFARSHRLSIANAFERKLVRKDVVAELVRLHQLEIEHKADVSLSQSQDVSPAQHVPPLDFPLTKCLML
jgi:hypothetical protein